MTRKNIKLETLETELRKIAWVDVSPFGDTFCKVKVDYARTFSAIEEELKKRGVFVRYAEEKLTIIAKLV